MRLGVFPASQKLVLVTPQSFRKHLSIRSTSATTGQFPTSRSCLSYTLERALYEQIIGYFDSHLIIPETQSLYRKTRSTETATTYQAANADLVTLLGLFDLSAAFDKVDHLILFKGITGRVIEWSQSLTGRTQFIWFNGTTSRPRSDLVHIPRRSSTSSSSTVSGIQLSPTTHKSMVISLKRMLPLWWFGWFHASNMSTPG